MPNVQSKFSTYRKLVPTKYVNRITLELQRTFLVALSLLKAHRRKAILLSLGPATILKFITVILPIIKLLPPTIKAIKTLSYFTSSSSSTATRNGGGNSSNGANALANREANASAAAAEGLGMSMDELSEILWTPAEDTYWERVNAMMTRFGLCKTLGVSLAGVRPGRVEIIMPFRTEVSGEGGAFHASLLPTLIAMTSQLTGMTLLPRHFTLKPIDFKCNILSDCDASTYLLVSRGAVVVRGDHSITVKVEIMKASGLLPGSSDIVTSPSTPSASYRPAMFSWKSWVGATTAPPPLPSPTATGGNVLVPGTGIERSKFVVCASGMQTSVVVRAGTDQDNEEEYEIQRLKREREERLRRSSSTSSSSSSSLIADTVEDAIVLGDSFLPLSSRPISPTVVTTSKSLEHHHQQHQQQDVLTQSTDSSSFEAVLPSSSFVVESKELHQSVPVPGSKTTTAAKPMSYASAVRHQPESVVPHLQLHQYEQTSDTEVWQR
ncbi:hypothetical protein BC939DRAFT_445977 [Gamsiella multidivaricata]|uniref:uncharacterized protein n=1 Tax=Gamsiella multidivaricata TaxID=101098 RepID=UPI00221F7D5E|nr:uncharacterized protein BC939DRAFT_445977 [Gamsiella multidivaricata]KAI7827176.1 hypothetical protein BC939DRAFT_445977 [Gamsiella multidivaricata]